MSSPGSSSPNRAESLVDRILESGSPVQSVLLFGEQGSGYDTIAEKLVRGWLGTDGPYTGELDRCVDFQHVTPYGDGNQIKIDSITDKKPDSRTSDQPESDDTSDEQSKAPKKNEFQGIPLILFFRTPPLKNRCKVIWFSPADRMNIKTANALLKSLEELPPFARVVLTTSRPSSILPTIRSRCVTVGCPTDPGTPLPGGIETFASTPGDREFIAAHTETAQQLHDLLEYATAAPPIAAIKVSETFGELAASLAKDASMDRRQAYVVLLEWAARWSVRREAPNVRFLDDVNKAARYIQGNVSANLVLDDLFAGFLEHNRELVPQNGR